MEQENLDHTQEEHTTWEPNTFVLDDSIDFNMLGLACINAIKTEDEQAYVNVFSILEATIIANSYLEIFTKLANDRG